jgi:hypothetical protein
MSHYRIFIRAGLGLAHSLAVALPLLSAAPATAAVYCKAVGIPKGCIVRPPVAPAIYCTAPGRPVGCVARPAVRAPGVGVPGIGVPGIGAPGVGVAPANRGGPVNRRGIR